MERLEAFLKKFERLAAPHRVPRERIAEYCREKLNVNIPIADIRVNHGVAYIDAPALIKGELHLRKEELIAYVNTDSAEMLHDIR
jgi:hypothetical protein